jgi:hypothetical protein
LRLEFFFYTIALLFSFWENASFFFLKGKGVRQKTSRRRKWVKRLFRFFLVFLLLLASFLYWLKVSILSEDSIRQSVLEYLQKNFQGEIALGEVEWIEDGFFYGGLRFSQIKVQEKEKTNPFVSIEEIRVSFAFRWSMDWKRLVSLRQIVVKKPVLSIERLSENHWNFLEIYSPKVEASSEKPDSPLDLLELDLSWIPVIQLEELQLHYQDKYLFSEEIQMILGGKLNREHGLYQAIFHAKEKHLGSLVLELTVEGNFSKENTLPLSQIKRLECTLSTDEPIFLHSQLFKILSQELHLEPWFKEIEPYHPEGKLRFNATIQWEPSDPKPRYEFTIDFTEISALLFPGEPLKVEQVEVHLLKKSTSPALDFKLKGFLEESLLEVEGELADLNPQAHFQVQTRLNSFSLDAAWSHKLPEGIRKFWKEYQICGELSFQGSLEKPQGFGFGEIQHYSLKSAEISIRKGEVQPPLLHFPLKKVQGTFSFQKDRIVIPEDHPLQTEVLDGKIRFWGELLREQWWTFLQNPLPPPRFQFQLRAEELHLYPELYETLKIDPDLGNIWKLLNPSGFIGGQASAQGQWTGNIDDIDWKAECVVDKSIELCTRVFPLKIYGASGRVSINKDEIRFSEGSGYDIPNLSGKPNLFLDYGRIAPLDSGEVVLHLRGERVSATEHVYNAAIQAKKGVHKILDRYRPQGLYNIRTEIYGPPGKDVDFDVKIAIDPVEAYLDFQPYPESNSGRLLFHEVKGRLEILPGQIRIHQLTGKMHQGGSLIVDGDFLLPQNGEDEFLLKIKGQEVVFDEMLFQALKPEEQGIWEILRPTGTVQFEMELEQKAGESEPALRVQLYPHVCSVSPQPLPYTLALDSKGSIQIDPERIRIQHIQGNHQQFQLGLEGTIERKADGSPNGFNFHVSSERLLLEERLNSYLPPQAQSIWEELKPQGEIRFISHVQQKPEEEVNFNLEIYAIDVSATYKEFPYPLEKLQGLLKIDSQAQKVRIEKLQGERFGALFTFDGELAFQEKDFSADLSISATNLLVNEALKKAIHSKHYPLWDMFQPYGVLDVQAHLSKKWEAPLEKRLSIQVKTGTITYEEFRLPVDHLQGEVEVYNDRVVLHQLQGYARESAVYFEGSIEDYQSSSLLRLSTHFSPTRLDDTFGNALPPEFHKLWQSLNPKGEISGEGFLQISRDTSEKYEILYKGILHFKENEIQAGLKLKDINGLLHFDGKMYKRQHRFRGKIELETCAITDILKEDIHLNNVSSEVLLQSHYLMLNQIKASLYEGQAQGDIRLDTSFYQGYEIDLQLKDIHLAPFARDLWKNQDFEISGDLDLALEVQGNSADIHSAVGRGWIKVSDARLWELPVFLGILDMLNLTTTGNLSAFESGSLEFKINQGQIDIPKMHFFSTPLSLEGQGILDFDLNMDFYFNAIIAPSLFPKIPIFTETWQDIKGNIVLLRLYGSYPQLSQSILPFKSLTEAFGKNHQPSLEALKTENPRKK